MRLIGTIVVAASLIAVFFGLKAYRDSSSSVEVSGPSYSSSTAAALIEESDARETSEDDEFWLNSGGLAYRDGGILRPFAGELVQGSKWQARYAATNPGDTDGGYHPQSIFRLFTKDEFLNAEESMYFRITRIIPSGSPNRNESNGIFLIHRAQNGDNLYYIGLRVDGNAVIKKKVAGAYSTLAEVPVFGYSRYDRRTMPSLIPKNLWIGLRATVVSRPDSRAELALWIDLGRNGEWTKILDVVDSEASTGAPVITAAGHGGIRSDFMEFEAEDYRIKGI